MIRGFVVGVLFTLSAGALAFPDDAPSSSDISHLTVLLNIQEREIIALQEAMLKMQEDMANRPSPMEAVVAVTSHLEERINRLSARVQALEKENAALRKARAGN
jgi:archaellum component FlaC